MRGNSASAAAFVIALWALGSATSSQAAPPPEGWVVYPTPKPDACEWSRANYSKRSWRVRLEGERVVIEPESGARPARPDAPTFDIPTISPSPFPPQPPCDDCVLRVDDGWLAGFNHGEWGGGLWWTDADGKHAYPIVDYGRCADIADSGPLLWGEKRGERWQISNIVSLHAADRDVFVFASLAHLGPSIGYVSRIERTDGRWKGCVVRNIEGAPEAVIAESKDSWLALTAGGIAPERPGALIRVRADGRLQRLAEPAFLGLNAGVYPNSMVKLPDGTLFVGMRHFAARLAPDAGGGYTVELLVPKDRPPFDFEPSIDDPSYEFYGHAPLCPPLRNTKP